MAALEKQKSKLPNLPSFDSSNPLNKNKANVLDVPKIAIKTSPLGGLSGPLGGGLSNPLGGVAKKNINEKSLVPPMPSLHKEIPKKPQNTKKNLFDDDDEEDNTFGKKK